MTIFESITRSQLLLEKLASNEQSHGSDEITTVLRSLSTELENINVFAQQLGKDNSAVGTQIPAKPEIKSGCYIFANEKGFFCPNCYDHRDNKIATTRINKNLRICPACRTSIK